MAARRHGSIPEPAVGRLFFAALSARAGGRVAARLGAAVPRKCANRGMNEKLRSYKSV